MQVLRQPLDDLGAPALRGLPRQNVSADLPVQQHQLTVDRQRGALLGSVDAGFELGQSAGLAFGCWGQLDRFVTHAVFPGCVPTPSPRLRGERWGEGRRLLVAVVWLHSSNSFSSRSVSFMDAQPSL